MSRVGAAAYWSRKVAPRCTVHGVGTIRDTNHSRYRNGDVVPENGPKDLLREGQWTPTCSLREAYVCVTWVGKAGDPT
eukprot:scaffold1299_cov385-Pavlova_lutheri.AAC.7